MGNDPGTPTKMIILERQNDTAQYRSVREAKESGLVQDPLSAKETCC